jgi:predicted RNA-binding Zn-ribbon protein involved in translation (DUF1610 family)
MDRPRNLLKEIIYHVTCPCGNEFTERCYSDEDEPECLECPSCGLELTMPDFIGEM